MSLKWYPLPLKIDWYKDGYHLKHILGVGRSLCLCVSLSYPWNVCVWCDHSWCMFKPLVCIMGIVLPSKISQWPLVMFKRGRWKVELECYFLCFCPLHCAKTKFQEAIKRNPDQECCSLHWEECPGLVQRHFVCELKSGLGSVHWHFACLIWLKKNFFEHNQVEICNQWITGLKPMPFCKYVCTDLLFTHSFFFLTVRITIRKITCFGGIWQ